MIENYRIKKQINITYKIIKTNNIQINNIQTNNIIHKKKIKVVRIQKKWI